MQHTLQEVRNNLKKLSEKFHIILIVDELDRCLPEYAINVLERLHHICNEIPVIQILAINKKSLADSIAKVFGKHYTQENNPEVWANLFCESYLQKFVDVIIPLSNGKLDKQLEVLNGIEKLFQPYNRQNFLNQDFIKVDAPFLALFITGLMDGIERRLQEKIFKQVALCHKLTIQSGIQVREEKITYSILIYEIISCICRYVFHSKETCKLGINKNNHVLSFYDIVNGSFIPETTEYITLQKNIQDFLKYPIKPYNDEDGYHQYAYEIVDTKSYILAYFTEQRTRLVDQFQNMLWKRIADDKIFLQKYDEIMNLLTFQ